ncbi:MAG: DUF4013 domain-containing protein [Polyangiales bacterium]
MDPLLGYRRFFGDPSWGTKLLAASLLYLTGMCVPLVGQLAVDGWVALVTREAVRGEDEELPPLDWDFDYLVKLLILGTFTLLVRLVWQLPVYFLMVAVGMTAMIVGVAGAAADPERAWLAIALGLSVLVAGGLLCLVLMVPGMVAIFRVQVSGDLGKAFEFGAILDYTKRTFFAVVGYHLVAFVVAIPIVFAGMLLCGLGSIPALVIVQVGVAFVFVRIHERQLAAGGPEIPLGPRELPHPHRPTPPRAF